MKTSRKPSSNRAERSQRSLQGHPAPQTPYLFEKAFRMPAWDETGPDGQVIPTWVVVRRLVKHERYLAHKVSRLNPALVTATTVQLSVYVPIPDAADPDNPEKMHAGERLFHPADIPLLQDTPGLDALALFAMGLEAQGETIYE